MNLALNTHQVQPGVLCIAIGGEIDMSTTDQLSDALTTAILTQHVTTVQVDLSAVTFLDSVGIGTLIQGMNLAAEHQREYHVINARGRVQRVLQLTGMLDVLTGEDTERQP